MVEHVSLGRLGLLQAAEGVADLGQPHPVEVVRVRVERVDLARLQRAVDLREDIPGRPAPRLGHGHLGEGFGGAALVVAHDLQPRQRDPRPVEHLLRGRRERCPLRLRQPLIDCPAAEEEEALALLEIQHAEQRLQVGVDTGRLHPEAKTHPGHAPVRGRLLVRWQPHLSLLRVRRAPLGIVAILQDLAARVLPVPLGDPLLLIRLDITHHQCLAEQRPPLRGQLTTRPPAGEEDVPLDGGELLERLRQILGAVREGSEIRQGERCLLRQPVPLERVRDPGDGVQTPLLQRDELACRDAAVAGEVILLAQRWRLQRVPGGVGVLQRNLRAVAGAALVGQQGSRPIRQFDLGLASLIEDVLVEDLPERLTGRVIGAPVELEVGGDGLQRLAEHRVVLALPYLLVQKRRHRRVEGGELG